MSHWPDEVTVKRADLELVLRLLPGVTRHPVQERLEVALNGGHELRCRVRGHWWDDPVGNHATCLRSACGTSRDWNHKRGSFVYSHVAERADATR